MHKFAMEIAECLKAKVKAIGIDNIEGVNLEELKEWSDIISNIVCFDKDYKIVEAMEKENDPDKSMEMYRKYSEDEYPEKGMKMDNHSYNDWSSRDYKERMRDIDRYYGDRMYYTGDMMPMRPQYPRMYFDEMVDRRDTNGSGGNHFTNPMLRDYREGRSGMSRRMYMESKATGDKNAKIDKLDKYLEELKADMKEMIEDMTPEEKSMWKQRLANMSSTM